MYLQIGMQNIDWFRDAKWGVFIHYLVSPKVTPEKWNDQVNRFDVQGLVDQIASINAQYLIFTIGQNSGHYCAPNSIYDDFVGIKPSKCSQRDLIIDLSEKLAQQDINLLVYLPSGAPDKDKTAMQKLEWKRGKYPSYSYPEGGPKGDVEERLEKFQQKWEKIIGEWSEQWGNAVKGWWFDGCYFARAMYEHPDPPNFQSFAAAARKGTPSSIIAFNPGVTVPIISITEYEDYTAGEISNKMPDCPGRWVNQAQYHILTYLGKFWGKGNPRFKDDYILNYVKRIVEKEGVITFDVETSKAGYLRKSCLRQLRVLREI